MSNLYFLFTLLLNISTNSVIRGPDPNITASEISQCLNFNLSKLNINRPIGVKNASAIIKNIVAHNPILNLVNGFATLIKIIILIPANNSNDAVLLYVISDPMYLDITKVLVVNIESINPFGILTVNTLSKNPFSTLPVLGNNAKKNAGIPIAQLPTNDN